MGLMSSMIRINTIFCGLLATMLLANVANALEIHSELCLRGYPSGSPRTNDLIVRSIYILSHNDVTKFADWVAYRVSEDTIGSSDRRGRMPDPLLAENETLENDDYTDAHELIGTDRGHQVALASVAGHEDWRTANLLSVLTPQKSDLNQGPWVKLEEAVRALVQDSEYGVIYISTGTLYEKKMVSLPNADEIHLIPSGYWKIVAVESTQEDMEGVFATGFIMDQESGRRDSHCDENKYATPREIEIRTGLDFFHQLDRETQETIEMGDQTLRTELGCPAMVDTESRY